MNRRVFKGLGKYLTGTYWRVRLGLLWSGLPAAKIQQVIHFDLDRSSGVPADAYDRTTPLAYWRPGMPQPERAEDYKSQ